MLGGLSSLIGAPSAGKLMLYFVVLFSLLVAQFGVCCSFLWVLPDTNERHLVASRVRLLNVFHYITS